MDDPYATLGRALVAALEPIVREAVQEARRTELAQALPEPYASRLALRPQEAAEALGLSRSVIDAEINAGRLASKKLGHARLIPLEEIKKWLARIDP